MLSAFENYGAILFAQGNIHNPECDRLKGLTIYLPNPDSGNIRQKRPVVFIKS